MVNEMANYKNVKLKVSKSNSRLFFRENTLVKGRIMNDGTFHAKDNYGVWFKLNSNMTLNCENYLGDSFVIEFVIVKTKTIKCTGVNHSMKTKKTFKPGKRYQIESVRPLGAVAGYAYDENGDRFTLYRDEIGFYVACGLATFEAKYS